MARDHDTGTDGFSESGRLASIEVAGDSPLWAVAVDGEERDINREALERGNQSLVPNRISAVIEREFIPAHHLAKKPATTQRIPLDGVMGGSDPVDLQSRHLGRLPIIQLDEPSGRLRAEPLGGDRVVGGGQAPAGLRIR